MTFQTRFLSKASTADVAFVRPFTSMRPLVSAKMARRYSVIVAEFAPVASGGFAVVRDGVNEKPMTVMMS